MKEAADRTVWETIIREAKVLDGLLHLGEIVV